VHETLSYVLKVLVYEASILLILLVEMFLERMGFSVNHVRGMPAVNHASGLQSKISYMFNEEMLFTNEANKAELMHSRKCRVLTFEGIRVISWMPTHIFAVSTLSRGGCSTCKYCGFFTDPLSRQTFSY
jgi:hypothetical protein